MILIRASRSASSNQPSPVGLEASSGSVPLEPPAVGRDTLWAVADDAVPPGDARRVRTLPQRLDLPVGHPRRGQRLLAMVPAGCPDLCLDAGGRLVAAGPDGLPYIAPPLTPPKPTEIVEERPR